MLYIYRYQIKRTILCLLFIVSFAGALQAQLLPEVEELGLWCVYIETENGEEPTNDVLYAPAGCLGESITNMNKVPCRVFIRFGGGIIFDSGAYEEKESGATIRVRGNSSASQYEKKPYKLKLQKKADLLCRGDEKYNDKDWLLIKNWGLHGLIGFKMNEKVGLPYAPQFRYVNVVLNGTYRGTYLLCESIKRNKDCRINVDKTSGYIFEYDAYWWKEPVYVESAYSTPMHYTFKYPEEEDLDEDRINAFADYIRIVESSMKSDASYDYIDYDNFVLWVLGQDLLGNYDACGSNMFLAKYDDSPVSKIFMPCMWDFDGIIKKERLPNVFASVHDYFYFQDLFKNPRFIQTYCELSDELISGICQDMINDINDFVNSEYGAAYERSYNKDMEIWDFYEQKNVKYPLSTWVEKYLEWFSTRPSDLSAAIAKLRTTTSVSRIPTNSNWHHAIYDLGGNNKNICPRGVNIVDGKKLVIKN